MDRKPLFVGVLVTSVAVTATAFYLRRQRSLKSADFISDDPKLIENGVDSVAPVQEVVLSSSTTTPRRILTRGSITIVHGSLTGTCTKFARQLYDRLKLNNDLIQLATAEDFDWWDELSNDDNEEGDSGDPALLVILISTFTNGAWPPSAAGLDSALQDLQNDWRIARFPLKGKLQVAVFGTGSSEYAEAGVCNMGKPAKDAVRAFQKLGAKCRGIAIGDDAVGSHAHETFQKWSNELVATCKCGTTTNGCCKSKALQLVEESDENIPSDREDEVDSDDDENQEPEVIDMEDMGDSILASQFDSSSEPREMVTPSQAAALKKEGYKLIGSHSAVKLCRWTKHQLRGRGGCYKHTFYGITSYQCMEATPSLACANKCVFCWRHHKNPVGKEWRWKTDDPYYIVDQAVKTHVGMIKEAKGIPGVQMSRWQEAHTVRHCALSLVGEPIMYPRINELLSELHRRNISSFLVTNGQHPHAIETLIPVTQLYVSVDAPTKESLIEIDRPLFKDAWDRLKQSLSALKTKGQRTVARLTVVKGWNSDEIEGYAQLIALGCVSLVEVKGVTFCGKSDASNLNMTNTPWHHEVVDLTRTLRQELRKIRQQDSSIPEYDLACEHKHSCSVLLARVDQFAVDDPSTGARTWKTWIDYDKFQSLVAKNAADSTFTFSVHDYTAETPSWALFGSQEEGFDPTDERVRKKVAKYTQFDENGVPTHDHNNEELSTEERHRLKILMDSKRREIGSGSTVTELKGGAKQVQDASLMFRGMVITKYK